MRSITRDEHEPLREATSQRMATAEGKKIYKIRAPGIEGVFGIIKSCLGIRRFSLRGLSNVRTEWIWICTAYNLKKLLATEARSASGDPDPGNPHCISPKKQGYRHIMRVSGTLFLQTIRHRILHTLKIPKCWTYAKKMATA